MDKRLEKRNKPRRPWQPPRLRPQSDDPGVHQSVTKMFCGGMKDDTTEAMVREVSEPFGNIKVSIIILISRLDC